MRKTFEPDTNEDGSSKMTEKNVLHICEQEGQYEYPELNTKLYLHYKAYQKIENLHNFKNVTTIFFENNLISKIENLDSLPNLTNLYLQNNILKKIEGLENCTKLVNLNLSKNQINVIENLENCQQLKNLDISHNFVKKCEDMKELEKLSSLSTLNLSNNFLEYDDTLLPTLINIPSLLVLYLCDNPCQRLFKSYRKEIIGSISKLTYLDDRPVNQQDRRLAEAWIQGGNEGMKKEREAMNEEKKKELEKDKDISRQKSYKKKKMRIMYFQQSLKTCILKQKTLEKQLKKANFDNDGNAIEFFNESILKQKQFQLDVEESLQNLKIQIKKIENKENLELIDEQNDPKIVLTEEEILIILESLVQKHQENTEDIYPEFEEIVKYMKENLDSDIEKQYQEREFLETNIEKIQENLKNSASSSQFSDSQSQNSSSLQQYDSDIDSDLQIQKSNSESQQSEPQDLDDLD